MEIANIFAQFLPLNKKFLDTNTFPNLV